MLICQSLLTIELRKATFTLSHMVSTTPYINILLCQLLDSNAEPSQELLASIPGFERKLLV
jgi:hypothetical protein